MIDERELLLAAERWFKIERDRHADARGHRRCKCTTYASRVLGAGVEVYCANAVGQPTCHFAVWWPRESLLSAIKAVA